MKRDTRWKKGQSGNPKGKPRSDLHLKNLTQEYTEEALETLVKWMRSDDSTASVNATKCILERGWGKPRQEIDLKSDAITGIEVIVTRKV